MSKARSAPTLAASMPLPTSARNWRRVEIMIAALLRGIRRESPPTPSTAGGWGVGFDLQATAQLLYPQDAAFSSLFILWGLLLLLLLLLLGFRFLRALNQVFIKGCISSFHHFTYPDGRAFQ